MQRPYNDRWERTRKYLLRNLLDYHGDLSPIPEEARSDSSGSRGGSPLPALLVEREPDRHDHGEDFYRRLEVRMRRYYRRLFVDGVSVNDVDLCDADDTSSEFEVNQSMASTFIIDVNNRSANNRHTAVAEENIEYNFANEHESQEVSKNRKRSSDTDGVMSVTEDKIVHRGIHRLSRSDVVSKEDETEISLNKIREPQVSDRASKSTDSDLAQSYHRISTIVAQVHEEQCVKAPRVFEDGSPVLMPKAHELNRCIFGKARNILSAVNDDSEEDFEEESREEQAQDTDLEVEFLMKSSDSISNVYQESIESSEGEETYKDVEQSQTSDSTGVEFVVFEDQDLKATNNDNESPLRTSESDGVTQVQNEESIGPNEFDYNELTRTDRHSKIQEEETLERIDSFEMAIRKGLFESKNARKTTLTSSDEEFEDKSFNSVFEPEVMRGTMQARLTEALRRDSTVSEDSPLAVKVATKATVEKLEEDDLVYDNNQIDASDVAMTEAREEDEDVSLEGELTTSQDSSVSDEPINHVDAEKLVACNNVEYASDASVDGDHETDEETEVITPSVTTMKSLVDVCDDIWSVSPVQINFEELPLKYHEVPSSSCGKDFNQKKRVSDSATNVNAVMNKKRKYNNIGIQTGTSKVDAHNWGSLKKDLFVGKPLVLTLCKCHDHVCP